MWRIMTSVGYVVVITAVQVPGPTCVPAITNQCNMSHAQWQPHCQKMLQIFISVFSVSCLMWQKLTEFQLKISSPLPGRWWRWLVCSVQWLQCCWCWRCPCPHSHLVMSAGALGRGNNLNTKKTTHPGNWRNDHQPPHCQPPSHHGKIQQWPRWQT